MDDLIVLNAMEGVTMDALHLTKCTSMAVNDQRTADGHVLIAHNEDWIPDDEEDVYLIHAEPDDEPAFLAMTYGGLLPNVGFNSAGLAQCCDTVYPTDSRIGIPRIFVSRAVLAAPTIGEAISRTLVPHGRRDITTYWRMKAASCITSKYPRGASRSFTGMKGISLIPISTSIPTCKPSNMSRMS